MIRKEALLIGIVTWIIVTLLYSKFGTGPDNETQIGFPWSFYSSTEGRSYIAVGANVGFNLTNLIIDAFCAIALILGINKFFAGTLKSKPTNPNL